MWGKIVKIAPLMSVVLLSISIMGSTYWYVTQKRLETERLRQETITGLKKDFASPVLVDRIGAVAALVDFPKDAIALMVTSSCLGAINTDTLKEETEFTAAVKNSLRQIGREAAMPLQRELRRIQSEIFRIFPNTWQAQFSELCSTFLDLNSFNRSNDDVKENLKRILKDRYSQSDENIESIIDELFKKETLELRLANKNVLQVLADILQTFHFEEFDLSGMYLYGNLSGAHLRRSNLSEANLEHVVLSAADLELADISNANLTAANLSHAKLISANMTNANLNAADLSNAILVKADLSEARVDNANLSGANLEQARLKGRAIYVNLARASLKGADLSLAILNESDLSNADLTDSKLSFAILRKANLSGVKGFRTVKDFRWANLKGVEGLSSDDLDYAESHGAELGDKVAIPLETLPLGVEIPKHLKQKIFYDASSKALVCDGHMTSEEMKELRDQYQEQPYSNAVFDLQSLSYWISR